MRNFKPIIGIVTGLIGVGYCAYLIHYFVGVSGSVKEANDIGLGPTLLGLTIVGSLLAIPVAFKVLGLFTDLRPFGRPPTDEGGGIDADAVIARYMAQQAAGGDVAPPRTNDVEAPRTSFGRRAK